MNKIPGAVNIHDLGRLVELEAFYKINVDFWCVPPIVSHK